jgi:hypothetical protein
MPSGTNTGAEAAVGGSPRISPYGITGRKYRYIDCHRALLKRRFNQLLIVGRPHPLNSDYDWWHVSADYRSAETSAESDGGKP